MSIRRFTRGPHGESTKSKRNIPDGSDRSFLERAFHKLLLNFTWWVNRKDAEGNNIFQGGFLGLDNIGVLDRSAVLPNGGVIEQSDATSWMGMYCLNMMTIALELSKQNPAYEDVASKFLEHFVHISRAMNNIAGRGYRALGPAGPTAITMCCGCRIGRLFRCVCARLLV